MPLGYFDYPCQDDLVCKVTIQDVPFFNAPIFLENKEQIGKIDEIFGNLRDYSVTVKPSENIKASSFKQQQKVSVFDWRCARGNASMQFSDFDGKCFSAWLFSCSLIRRNCCR